MQSGDTHTHLCPPRARPLSSISTRAPPPQAWLLACMMHHLAAPPIFHHDGMMAQLKRPWMWREDTGELIQRYEMHWIGKLLVLCVDSGAAAGYGQASQSKKAVSISSVPSLQDRSEPDRKVTLEDIKGSTMALFLCIFTLPSILPPVVGINLVSKRSLLSTHKRVSLLFDQCYRWENMASAGQHMLSGSCFQLLNRTDQMNYLLWSSLAYYDAYQHYCETSKNATSG